MIPKHFHGTLIAAGLATLAAFTLAGCNWVEAIAYVTQPDPKIEAVFFLPDKKTVVFVDDRRNLLNPSRLRRTIADRASEELMINKVITTAIAPRAAMAVASSHDRYRNVMTISEIGQEVGAEQVIYVEMMGFQLTADGYTPEPLIVCRIKVLDVVNDTRIFPPMTSDQSTHTLQVTIERPSTKDYLSREAQDALTEQLAIKAGDDIAKLFYKHDGATMGSRLQPR